MRTLLIIGLAASAVLVAGCSAGGEGADQVPAVLSTEDARDILPGPQGNFVVMVHLRPGGSTIPFVMRTPREARSLAASLADAIPAFVVDVPAGAAQPLVGADLPWQGAIISSESRLAPARLAETADQLAVDARLPGGRMTVDASITAWTEGNPSHMAGAYVIRGDACVAVVARQAPGNQWLLTAVPEWTDAAAVRELADQPGPLVLSDSTTLNPSRIEACQPGT